LRAALCLKALPSIIATTGQIMENCGMD
jgi:hypothetical protein